MFDTKAILSSARVPTWKVQDHRVVPSAIPSFDFCSLRPLTSIWVLGQIPHLRKAPPSISVPSAFSAPHCSGFFLHDHEWRGGWGGAPTTVVALEAGGGGSSSRRGRREKGATPRTGGSHGTQHERSRCRWCVPIHTSRPETRSVSTFFAMKGWRRYLPPYPTKERSGLAFHFADRKQQCV